MAEKPPSPQKSRKPFTRAFFAEARRMKAYPISEWLHGYIYMVYPYAYIGNAKGDLSVGKFVKRFLDFFSRIFPSRPRPPRPGHITFADTYHGKVVPLETARQLVTVRQPIQVSYPEQVIPYPLARDLILQEPGHIVALDCPCRASKPNPCLPLDVCLIVGEPFAGMVMEQHAKRARWISQEEAVNILKAEEERGHVHHAFFKQAVLGRFYAICNCCSCCCGAMQAQRNGTPMLASSGYLSRRDENLCQGCGTCAAVCQFHAISIRDGLSIIDESLCMGCGICVTHCPQGALSLELAPQKGQPLTLPTPVL